MRSRRTVATKPRAVPRLALDSRLGQTTALGALEPATRRAQSRPADMPRRTAVRHDLLRHAACTTRHATSDMPQAGARRSAVTHPAPRWFVCLCVCVFACLLVCLLVCSTDQQEDRHQGAHQLAVPHARAALCVCEYPVSTPRVLREYPVSTPTSPGPARPPPVLRGTAGYSPR
jgi:hypothetical protein